MKTEKIIKEIENWTATLMGSKYKELKGAKVSITLNQFGGIGVVGINKTSSHIRANYDTLLFAEKLLNIYNELDH